MKNQDNFTANLDSDVPQGISQATYGFKLPDRKETLEKVDIFAITPDPMQPRRVLPHNLRQWVPDLPGASDVFFHYWMDAAYRESVGDECNDSCEEWLIDLLRGDPEEYWNPIENPGPVMAGLLKVIDLAASIKRDGLTNPITVTRTPPQSVGEGNQTRYLLETGERRWYAYHLLHRFDTDGQWTTIPARVMPERNVWRQASENNQRDNLNAIGKARQYALLLMDLLTESLTPNPSGRGESLFLPVGAFEREQDFYAQVADAKQYRAPSGKNEQISNAMGVTRQMLSLYRGLLALPNAVWVQADDENLSFAEIEKLSNAFDNIPKAPYPAPGGEKVSRVAKMVQTLKKGVKPAIKEADESDRVGRLQMLTDAQTGVERLQELIDHITQLEGLG